MGDGDTKVTYRDPLRDIPDQWLFFGFFTAGAAAIWLLKLFGLGQLTVTAVPVALMLAYAGIAYVTKRYRIREDRIGDNIYYLGFLFTLVSLAYALWSFTTGETATETIITNFGIAIMTTIFGLAGRVFFNQMRDDPEEYEREARSSLAEAARGLKSQLDGIAIDMSSFKRGLTQILEDEISDISTAANEAIQANVTRFTNAGTDVIEKIEGAFRTFTDHSSKLNDLASRNVDALDALFQRIQKIEASPDLIAAKFDPVVSNFSELVEDLHERNRAHDETIEKLRDAVGAIAATSKMLHETMETGTESIREKFDGLGRGLEDGVAAATRLSQTLGQVTSAVGSELDASASVAARLKALLDEQIGAGEHAARELSNGVIAESQANLAAIKEFRAAMLADVEAMKRQRQESAAMLAESQSMVADLQKALVSLANLMTEKVRES